MAKFSQFKNEENKVSEEDIKSTFDSLKDMSQGELNQKLFEEVAKQKANGQFDYQALSDMVENMKAFLPQNDYENVKRLLETLK